MNNYLAYISVGKLTVASFLGLKPEGVFLLFAIVVIVMVLAGVYLIIIHYRKDLDYKHYELAAQANALYVQNEKLVIEIKKLKEKLEKEGNEWSEWKLANEKLVREIEDLKKQIQEINQKGGDSKKEVIIEYYMKDNESE